MNIGNITTDNFNLDSNGKDMQIEVYEQLIEQLQQENKQLKEKLDCDLQWAFKYEKQVDNWNKLKEFLVEKQKQGLSVISVGHVLYIMIGIERGESDE